MGVAIDTYGYHIMPRTRRHPLCKCKVRCVQRFRCEKCRGKYPWCFGMADEKPEYCDQCWADAEAAK